VLFPATFVDLSIQLRFAGRCESATICYLYAAALARMLPYLFVHQSVATYMGPAHAVIGAPLRSRLREPSITHLAFRTDPYADDY
jgi:hypothetical protein